MPFRSVCCFFPLVLSDTDASKAIQTAARPLTLLEPGLKRYREGHVGEGHGRHKQSSLRAPSVEFRPPHVVMHVVTNKSGRMHLIKPIKVPCWVALERI